MKYDYQYKITIKLNQHFDVNTLKRMCNQYPNSKILIEVQNTKGITSSMIKQLPQNVAIRIAGGYDEERMARYKGQYFGNESTEDYYYNSVIYTKNETIKILEEIERIESGINRNWSNIQKLIYVYDRLKRGIMYDPKFEQRFSSEIRSLRGLITKQTVCAGYAVILKEFMDRNNIECEFVRGGTKSGQTSGHAWNIVTIDGKKYPIDLTWDNTRFRSGKFTGFDWLGQDVSKFSKVHYPAPGEKTQDYEHTLSQINLDLIREMYLQMGVGRAIDYSSTTYSGTRKDGSRFIVAQVGNATIDNTDYYRYYFVEISKDGKKQQPIILYSDDNLTNFINYKKFRKPKREDFSNANEYNKELKLFDERIQRIDNIFDNVLFSKENIADSIAKKSFYIGKISDNPKITTYQEIAKPEEKRKLFVYPTKRFTRSDGSVLIAQQMLGEPQKVCGIDVMRYDIFEMVNENGKEVLKRNTVFTERNFFKDTRQSMVDDYLSRERLDRKVHEAGGYIGYYDANGIRTYNPNLVNYFETSKKIDIDSLNREKQQTYTPAVQIPNFSELKSLASKYEIFIDSKDLFDPDTSKIKIRDIKTGQIQTDQSIIDRAMFANIWLSSAGVKYYHDDLRPGSKYAFNEPAEELYNTICKQLLSTCKDKGVIDTVDLLRNIHNVNVYKYNKEIILNLFKTPYQTEMINKLFLQSLGINHQVQKPEALYTMNYAYQLAYGDDNRNMKGR